MRRITHAPSFRRATRLIRRAVRCLGTLVLLAAALDAVAQSGWQSIVSSELLAIYKQATSSTSSRQIQSTPSSHIDSGGRVQVDVVFDCSLPAPTQALRAAGLSVNATVKVPPFCVVEGWVLPTALPKLAAVSGVQRIKLPVYARHRVPKVSISDKKARVGQALPQGAGGGQAIDGNAVTIMHADQFVASTRVSGAGVTVGVMSDNVTSIATIQGRGELPNVTVVPASAGGSLNSNSGDEGTMMLEEVHAVAPGASLAFCSPETDVEYVGCLGQLAAAGATILVDDLTYPQEDLMSSNGTFAAGVQTLLAQNSKVLLFTVTENYNGSYWEGTYTPVSIAALNIGITSIFCPSSNQVDYYLNSFSGVEGEALAVGLANTYNVTLQWADPFDQNVSNFDLYWIDTVTNAKGCLGSAGSSATLFDSPMAFTTDTYDVYLATPDASMAGKYVKLWIGGDGATALSGSTPGSIVSPQAFVSGVITTGAVSAADGIGNTLEPYSGQGPVHLVFPTPVSLQAPSLVSLDEVYVDAAGTTFTTDSGGLFPGTSAAAPNAAAVAALIRSAFPGLTPSQLTNALQTGAVQLGSAVPDGMYGYGRVDAVGALDTLPVPTISALGKMTIVGGTSSAPTGLTLGGLGNLVVSVQSSNPALVPASLVSAGAAGVTLSPGSCGAPTTSCMISVTPVIGQVGTATLTVVVTDGANRSAQTMSTITVTAPAPPTISVMSGGSQTVMEGGATSPISFTLTGTGALSVTAGSSNTTLVPNSAVSLSSGCGSTTKSCSATLAAASGQAGSSTITLTVKDAYGQTGTASAALTVNDPPPSKSGGGGSFGIEELLLLSTTLLLRSAGRKPQATA
ncbi:MAG TPA: S8 family serine peptidase [Steroidobacteraceae bacterium]|nr:S8 family serine peptidase [Steroidobacteraceae bacterium]